MDKNHFLFLKKLVALEEAEETEEIQQDFLSLTPREREFRGKALLGLRLVERHFSPAEHILTTFEKRDKTELPLFTLEVGDIVTLFIEKTDKAQKPQFPTGTVYEKDKTTLTVAFNQALPDWVDEEGTFQLHKSTNRLTYKRMVEALDAVYETQNTRLALFRDISINFKKPSKNNRTFKDLKFFDDGLNTSQKIAVQKSLEAKDVFLVHGPPGTGKTTVLIEIIRQAVQNKESVFVTAPSNTACDNILERLVEKKVNALRLGHPARITTSLREHTLDFKIALHPLGKFVTESQAELDKLYKRQERYEERRSPGYQAEKQLRGEISALKDEIKKLKQEIFEKVMYEQEVVLGTPTTIQDRSIRYQEFDLVIIDEATQATEPMTWLPMMKAKKVIMAGDHFQLPPTVRSIEAEEKGLGITLFERYYDILPEEYRQLLERQYRMNETIMGFSSREFYKNLLVADESVKNQTLSEMPGVQDNSQTKEPLLFIDTAGKGFEEKLEEGSESRYNLEEAELVLIELRKMLEAGVPPEQVAVISPYSAQVRYLTSKSPNPVVEIDSVDGFQGREKELVIVSLVRSNMEGELGFLADTRRMNVALTRARRKLIVIGDSATLCAIKFYKDFIEYAQEKNAYKTAWEE